METSSLFERLQTAIATTGKVFEDYGGFKIAIKDNDNFPWEHVFNMLANSGLQIWVVQENSHLQIKSKPEVN